MIRYIYVVHSDINEEAVYNEFDILDDAIEFAEEVVEYKPYIEQVEVEVNDFGETTTVGEKEIVWKCKELVRDEEAAMTPEEEDAYWDREYNNMLATESEDELTEGVDWTTLRKLKGIEVSKILKILKPMISAKRYKYLKDNPQLATIVNDLGADEKEKLLQALKLDECLMNEALDTSLVDKEILNSNLPKILHQLTDQELADFNMLHNDEETIIEGGRFNIYDLHANLELQPYNSLSRDEYEALVLSTIPESYNEVAGDYDELFRAIAKDLQISVEDLIGTASSDNLTNTELSENIDYDKLREELEENEDEVECQRCFDLVEKDNAIKTEHGYVCKHCYEKQNDAKSLNETAAVEDIKLEDEIKVPEVGTKIKIIHLEGEDNTYDGKVGVVESVDDENQLHGTWGGLAIIPDVDDFEIISEEAICKNNPVITHSDDDVKELKEGFSRYEVRTYYPEEPGPENFSYVYFDSLEEAEAYCQEHKASLAKSETSNSGIYEVEYLGGNGESAAPVKYVDKDGNLVDDEPASFDVNTVVEVITAIPKLTDSELVDKFNQIDPQLKAEYTDGKYFLFGKEVTKKDIVSQFITKWFDPETRATVEQLLGIQAIKESLTESATLEYYKKFVNSKSRDIDFMKRAGSDIYYVDEVAPGLHSVAELSEAELEELSEYVLKLGKTATDNYNNKLQKGNSKNTISNGIAESYEDYEEGEEISFLDWYDKVNYTDSAFLKGAGNKLEKLITFDENDDIKIDRKNEAALRELVDKFSYALYSRTQPVLIANGQIYTKSEPVFISKTDADYYAAEPRYQLDVIKYDVDISPEFFA